MKIVVISDIHANYLALQEVEKTVVKNCSLDEVLYLLLGDVVGYGPLSDVIPCIQWVRDHNCIWVPGNHDEWLVAPRIREIRLSPPAQVTLLAHGKYLKQPDNAETWDWFKQKVSGLLERDQDREISSIWKDHFKNKQNELLVIGTHGGVDQVVRRTSYVNPWEFMEIKTEISQASRLDGSANHLALFHGHTHFQALMRQNSNNDIAPLPIVFGEPILLTGHSLINPGSVGAPRDGDSRAAFAIFDSNDFTVTFYRIPYANEETARRLGNDAYLNNFRHLLKGSDRKQIREELRSTCDPDGHGFDADKYWEAAYTTLINRILKGGENDLYYQNYRSIYRRLPDALEVNELNYPVTGGKV